MVVVNLFCSQLHSLDISFHFPQHKSKGIANCNKNELLKREVIVKTQNYRTTEKRWNFGAEVNFRNFKCIVSKPVQNDAT